MTRTVLDTELATLNTQIIQLGALVENAIQQVLEAVEHNDVATCGLVVASDVRIDALRADCEQRAFRMLTLQQPLGARDLRFLTSSVAIVGDLERAGDGAAGIAKMLLTMPSLKKISLQSAEEETPTHEVEIQTTNSVLSSGSLKEASVMAGILDLGHEAANLLQRTMTAFAERDAKAACAIWHEDDVVDVRYHLVRHDLLALLEGAHALSALSQDELVLQRMTYLLWMAHKLERIADHCTNICERIVFFLEGTTSIPPTQEQ